MGIHLAHCDTTSTTCADEQQCICTAMHRFNLLCSLAAVVTLTVQKRYGKIQTRSLLRISTLIGKHHPRGCKIGSSGTLSPTLLLPARALAAFILKLQTDFHRAVSLILFPSPSKDTTPQAQAFPGRHAPSNHTRLQEFMDGRRCSNISTNSCKSLWPPMVLEAAQLF